MVVNGETMLLEVVVPLLHKYPEPPDAVNVVLVPLQMVTFVEAEAITTGYRFTVNVESSVTEQLVAILVARIVKEVGCVNPLIGKVNVFPFPVCGFP